MGSLLNNRVTSVTSEETATLKCLGGLSWGCGGNQDTQDSDSVARCPSVLPREPHRPPASFAFRVFGVNGVPLAPSDWNAILVSYIMSS